MNRLLGLLFTLIAIAGTGCRQTPAPEAVSPAPSASSQAEMKPPSPASSFRSAYDAFAAARTDDDYRRARAAASLAALQGGVSTEDARLVQPLIARLQEDSAAARLAALTLLDALARAEAVPAADAGRARTAIARLLADPDELVRVEATRSVSEWRDPRWLDALTGQADDAAIAVRLQALTGLRLLDTRDAKAVAAARARLDDPDPQVRALAQQIASPHPD